MFNTANTPELRIKQSSNIAKLFETIKLDLSNPEYQFLANKLHFISDLSNYRFIALFDGSTEAGNDERYFDCTLLYSSIIKLHPPSLLENLLTYARSIITSFSLNLEEKTETEKFITIWEKRHPLIIPEIEAFKPLLGTIEESIDEDNGAKKSIIIDKYFLSYLFLNELNSKCLPILDTQNNTPLANDKIYEDYKFNLPKIAGLNFFERLNLLRGCLISDEKQDPFIVNTNDVFILKAKDHNYEINLISSSSICQSLGGVLATTSDMVENMRTECENIPHFSQAKNDLFSINCETINETISALGNIEDIFGY